MTSEDTDQSIMQIFWEGFYGELVRANEQERQIGDRPAIITKRRLKRN